MEAHAEALIDAASRPFRPAGRLAYHFARGKLRHDPMYFALLRKRLVHDDARVLDLGCGQGILLSLLAHAAEAGWPNAPRRLCLIGTELRRKQVRTARLALGQRARIEPLDLRHADVPASDVVVLQDVLHYMPPYAQIRLLEKVAGALTSNGWLLLREADASPGLAAFATRTTERLAAITRGDFLQRFHFRQAREWPALLNALGFAVSAEPMNAGPQFDNVLILARRRT